MGNLSKFEMVETARGSYVIGKRKAWISFEIKTKWDFKDCEGTGADIQRPMPCTTTSLYPPPRKWTSE